MKTTALFLLCLLGLISTSLAGTWTVEPWTGDADTGIVNGETQWAYHFGSTTSATVNGVSVPGFATLPVSVAGQLELTGAQFVLTFDPNNLTSLGGSSSAVLGSSFFYGGVPSTNLTVKAASLQSGLKYVVSLMSVGWDGVGDQRLIKFVSGTDELAIDQNLYGENFGLRADYAFTAGAGDQVLRVDMNNAFNRSFHVYAVSLRKVMFDPSVTLTSSANPTEPATSVTFTATVAGPVGEATPGGTVEFKNGGTTIGSGTLNGSGVATFSASALAVGTHSITASYLGAGNFKPAVSNTVSQAVTGIFTVTSAANSGSGSLAETITAASSGSYIVFDSALAGQTVQMPTSEIIVDKDLTIDGAALAGAALQGTSTNRLFYIPVTRTVVFKNLTLAGGGGVGAANTLRGGAVLNAGSFTAMDCIFRDNQASLGPGVASGYSTQNTSLTLQRCLFSGNAATTGFGGALMNTCLNGITSEALVEACTFTGNSTPVGGGGAIYNAGSNGIANMTLRQCTITGNTATSSDGGGGVLNYANAATGTANMTLTHCTIVKNTSLQRGGGVSQSAVTGSTASITLTSNIIAENTASLGPDVRLAQGTGTSQGTNLIGNATDSGITWLGSDLTGTSGVPLDALLASLGYYGGPTPTCPPLLGSAALDAAPTPAFSTDQRGLPRVVDADGIGGALADIGAVESSFVQVDVATDELETPAGENDVSLREALRDAPAGAIITFAPGLDGQTLTLDGVLGELVLTKDVTVDAASLPAGLRIGLGTGNHRLVEVPSGVSANLRNLRFRGGAGTVSAAGGALQNAGRLSLSRCSFTGLKSSNSGGAVNMTGGSMEVSDSTFSSNTAGGNGGAIAIFGGSATFSQCTIQGNTGSVVGGGLAILGGSTALVHCTITGNNVPDGGASGVYLHVDSTLSLHNSIVAGNTSTGESADIANAPGIMTRTGANVIGSNEGVTTVFPAGLPNANGDYVGTATAPLNPLLGALANNGGWTQTCLPLPTSPATDHAAGTIPTTDQRGFSRPRDGNGDNSFIADIGAAESGPEPVFVVNTLADELDTPPGASLSLREAVREAFPGSVITFAPALSGKTITLDPAKLDIVIPRTLLIDASALPGGLTLDASAGTSRHFYADSTVQSFELRNLTLVGGGGVGATNSGFGGSLLSLARTTLVDCTFRDNKSTNSGGAVVVAANTAQFIRCTFHDNRSTSVHGGALYLQTTTAVLDHCTLTRNHAEGGEGGAIFTRSGTNLTLTHCTIAGNTSSNANGGLCIVAQSGDKLTLNSTILAGNLGQDYRYYNDAPTTLSGGGNVMGLDAIFSTYAAAGDVRNITAAQLGLAELGRYGGLTDTMPPLPGSPALDAASLSTATTDQRGFARTVDGTFDSTATSDSGAAESFVVRATITFDQNDTPAGSQISLREALRDAPEGAVITTSTSSNLIITLGEIIPSRSFILASPNLTTRLFMYSPNNRDFYLPPGIRGHFSRITLEGGKGVGAVHSGRGGAVLNQGFLSMSDCTVQFCTANDGAGIANGLAATPSRLLLRRCRIISNTASGNGGAIFNNSREGGTATVEMENCLLHSNSATRNGAAVANLATNGAATVTSVHGTIMRNSASSSGGGIYTGQTGATTRLTSCIVADNSAGVSAPDLLTSGGGALVSGGTNLIGITDGIGAIWQANDITGTAAAPRAAQIAFENLTFQPLPGSPAIDAAQPTFILLDRSQLARTVDGDLSGTAQPDIGAQEVAALAVTTAADELDTPSGASVSLREALRDAGASGLSATTILRLGPALSGQTLTLNASLGELTMGGNVFLDASSLPGGFTIDGGPGANRIFSIGGTAHLRGLTLTGGAASGNGGAILSSGTLTLEDCVLRGNSATGSGGALSCLGTVILRRCTLTQNTASASGGALSFTGSNLVHLENSAFTANEAGERGGAISISFSSIGGNINNRLYQCTVEGNRSGQRGGGIYLSLCFMGISHCTIVNNEALTQRGGGLVLDPSGTRQSLQNTIVADNRAPTNPDLSADSQNNISWPATQGGNLIGVNAGASAAFPAGLPNATGDYVGTEAAPQKALVAPSGLYGGTVPTCPPMLGSPALERAISPPSLNLLLTTPNLSTFSLPTGDQRGFNRSVDGDFNGTARPDIGAAESVIVRVDVAADELDTPAGTNDVSLREALRDAPEGAVIGFAAALSGQTLTLGAAGHLEPPRSVVISASSLTTPVTLTPQANSRIFYVAPQRSLGLTHLNLTGANVTAGYGGAILSDGSLSLSDCSLTANIAGFDGGAISASGPSLTIKRCVFSGNQAGAGGAIVLLSFGTAANPRLTVEDSRFEANSCAGRGGAISHYAQGGGTCQTTVRRSSFSSNQAVVGGVIHHWANGGGSKLMLDSCTLSGNQASGSGAAVFSYTSNSGSSATTLNQCTLQQNSAVNDGAAVCFTDTAGSGQMQLSRCTLSENTTTGSGGAVAALGFTGGTSTITLDGSIIAGNTTAGGLPEVTVIGGGAVTSLGTNLIGKADGGGVTWLPGDLTGTTAAPLSAMLAALGNYGGPTQTMPPLPGSPARDPASGATSATGQVDQRGGARLVGTKVDIGAVEAGDTDAPGTIAFGTPLIRVQENVGVLQMPVFRTGGNIGTVEVMLATSTGSGVGFATATSDFTPIIGDVLNFGPGETVEYMPITIVSDPTVKEPHEDFTLTLSNVTGGATLGSQSTTTVRILDFVDTSAPSLTLTAPLANAIVSSSSVTVIGTAKDDKGLQAVQVQHNGGAWVDATLIGSPQLSNFSLAITATPGLNALVIRSVDEKGKISALTKRSFTYKVPSTLTVNINPAGAGTVTAGFAPNSTRDVGLTYKITATPKAGFFFSGWSANQQNIGLPLSTYPAAVSFVMKPGLSLTANFFSLSGVSTYAGTYQGVLEPNFNQSTPGNSNVGFATLSVTSTTGVVSGKVFIDGVSQSFTGQVLGGTVLFTPARSYELGIVRKGKPTITFTAQVSGGTNSNANFYYGSYQNGSFQTDGIIYAYRSPYSSKNKVPTSLVTGTSQRYNLIFPSVPDQPGISAYPPGTGIGSLILGSDGSAKIAGTLADNTTFTASTTLSSQHTIPLFASLYTNQGHIAGNINLVGPTGPGYDAYGVNLYWARPAQPKAQWYPLGWTKSLFIDLVGAKYILPPTSANQSFVPGLGPVDATNTNGNATLTFMDGLLTSPQNFPVNITTKNLVTPLPLKTKNFTLTLTPTTGEITGTFLHTDTKRPTFKATTIQKPGDYQGTYGFFMTVPPNTTSTAGQAGAAMLLPR